MTSKKPKKTSNSHTRSSRDDNNMPRQRKQNAPRGRLRKVPTCPPHLDPIGLGTDDLPCNLLQVQGSETSRRRPRGTEMLTPKPRTHNVESQGDAADPMAAGNCTGTRRRIRRRGRVSGRGARVTSSPARCRHRATLSPIEAPAQEGGRAEATLESSSRLLMPRRRRGRPPLSRGTTRSEGTQGAVQELPHVSRREADVGEVNDEAGDPGEASKDKEPDRGCSGGVLV